VNTYVIYLWKEDDTNEDWPSWKTEAVIFATQDDCNLHKTTQFHNPETVIVIEGLWQANMYHFKKCNFCVKIVDIKSSVLQLSAYVT
jgi:hypothetical protein